MKPLKVIRIYMEMAWEILPNNEIALRKDLKLEDLPRIHAHKYEGGFLAHIRSDLPLSIKTKLHALSSEEIWTNQDLVADILSEDAPCKNIGIDRIYYFRDLPDKKDFPDVEFENKCYVIKIDDEIASEAFSASENEFIADLAVETKEGYRRKGYARQVASAWGFNVIKSNRIGLYIHDSENFPSESLAKSLGVHFVSSTKEYF